MPSLNYAVLCDYARIDPASGVCHIIAAGIDTVVGDTEPFGRQIGVAILLEFTRGECGRPHKFELLVQDEDGRQLVRDTSTVTPECRDDLPPGWKAQAGAALNFSVVFPSFGNYSVELLVNDSSFKSMRLRTVPERQTVPMDRM